MSAAPSLRWSMFVALVAVIGTLPVRAQDPLPDIFEDAVDVRVVNLEVVVTDSDGRRITDLTAADFELTVDGEPVPIGFFSEIDSGVAAQAQASAQPSGQGDVEPAPGVSPGRQLGTSFLVFVDDALSIGQDRDRVLDGISQQLLVAGSNDRVSIVAYDGKKLTSLASWTSDRQELDAAIEAAKARPAFGAMARAELRSGDQFAEDREYLERTQEMMIQDGLQTSSPLGGGDDGGGGNSTDSTFDREPGEEILTGFLRGADLSTAQRLSQTIENGITAGVHAMRSSGAPSGRKVMVMLLGGWPLSPAGYVANRFGDNQRDVATAELDLSYAKGNALYGPLTDTANLLGFTLYPVDVAGNTRRVGWDATDSPDQFELDSPTVGAGPATPDRELNVHAAFDHMAKSTGGLSMLNSQRDDAFQRAFDDNRSFYWLGFTPSRTGDDSNHRVRVRIKSRPDVEVRYRGSFVDRSRDTEQELAIEGALLFADVTEATTTAEPAVGELAVNYGQPAKAGSRKVEVAVEVGIPVSSVTLLQQNGRFLGQLEIRFLVTDDDGNRSNVSVDKIPINGGAAPQVGQRLWYETKLVLRKRSHKVVAMVYDVLSGATWTNATQLSM